MPPLTFTTDAVPAEQRLTLFRAGASSYQVDALDDPLGFAARWRVLRLGDLNGLVATVTPVSYLRTAERIAFDGEDRLVFFHVRAGRAHGMLDGVPVDVGQGGAMVWDLSRPLDMRAPGGLSVQAVTLPRFMVEEVMPGVTLSGVIAPSPALALATGHLAFLFDQADALPDDATPFQGRALRDMLAMAMRPLYLDRGGDPSPAPVLQRIVDHLDRRPAGDWTVALLADALSLSPAEVDGTVERFGGLDDLVERRRLLAAYRLLCDPAETAAVSVIAARCGFTDMPRFSRRFRAVFHTTATDLRLHHRGYLPEWAGAYHLEVSYGALRAR